MFCSHCGIKVEGNPVYCPNCGEKLPLHEIKKRFPLGVRLLGAAVLIALVAYFFFFLIEPDPKNVIIDQLTALKNHQLTEAYYGYTTHDFQEATTLEKFKEVIRAFPYLSEVKNLEVTQKNEQDGLANLQVALTSEDNHTFVMEYQLMKDEGKWKIVYFKLLKEPVAPAKAKVDPEEVVREELKLLKENDIDTAYETTTSKDFRHTTDLQHFQDFIKNTPLMVNYQSYFPKKLENIDGGKKVVYVLKNEQDEKEVEYTLTEENGVWKVRGIRILTENSFQN